MSDPELRPCAHPGCRRWALFESHTCGVHAGRLPQPDSPRRGNARGLAQFPPVEETVGPDPALLQRDSLHRALALRAGYPHPAIADDLRILGALARATRDLASSQPAAMTGAEAIGAFLDTVTQRALDLAAAEAEAEAGPPAF